MSVPSPAGTVAVWGADMGGLCGGSGYWQGAALGPSEVRGHGRPSPKAGPWALAKGSEGGCCPAAPHRRKRLHLRENPRAMQICRAQLERRGHEGVASTTYRMDLTGPAPEGLRAPQVHVEQSVPHMAGLRAPPHGSREQSGVQGAHSEQGAPEPLLDPRHWGAYLGAAPPTSLCPARGTSSALPESGPSTRRKKNASFTDAQKCRRPGESPAPRTVSPAPRAESPAPRTESPAPGQ